MRLFYSDIKNVYKSLYQKYFVDLEKYHSPNKKKLEIFLTTTYKKKSKCTYACV